MIPIPLNGRRVPPLSNLVEGDPQRPPVYSVPSVHCKGYKKDSKIQNCHRKSSFNDCPQVVVPHENLWGVSRCNCETAIPWHTRPEVWTTFSERNDLATSLTHWQLNLFTRDILLWTWIPICVPSLQMGSHTCDKNPSWELSWHHIQEPPESWWPPKSAIPLSFEEHRSQDTQTWFAKICYVAIKFPLL